MRLSLKAPGFARQIASDLTDMDRDPRQVEPGEVIEYDLPDDVYFEYAFIDEGGRLLPDPAEERRAKSVWYGEVSYVTGPEYSPDDLADPPEGLKSGQVERLRLESDAMGGQTRRVSVYTPSEVDPGRPTPLALVQDGVAFLRIGELHLVAEALLGRGEIGPLRLAFIEPVDRMSEYAFDESYQRFVEGELEPLLRERFPLTDRRLFVGASLGALASATLAIRRAERSPELAGEDAVLSLSGAFLGSPGEFDAYRSRSSWLLERLADESRPVPGTWYLDVGTLEWLLDVNRRAAEVLDGRGDVRHAYAEHSAGHNWPHWKDALPAALRFVAGPS